MDIGSFLLVNLLNGLLVLILMPVGALSAVLVLHILVRLTPWRMKNVFEGGISGGTVLVAVVLFVIGLGIATAAM